MKSMEELFDGIRTRVRGMRDQQCQFSIKRAEAAIEYTVRPYFGLLRIKANENSMRLRNFASLSRITLQQGSDRSKHFQTSKP